MTFIIKFFQLLVQSLTNLVFKYYTLFTFEVKTTPNRMS